MPEYQALACLTRAGHQSSAAPLNVQDGLIPPLPYSGLPATIAAMIAANSVSLQLLQVSSTVAMQREARAQDSEQHEQH